MAQSLLDELIERFDLMPPEHQAEFARTAIEQTAHLRWIPVPGAQAAAYFSEADELFYGGSAGSGKTSLGAGLAVNEHSQSLILRREREQVYDIFEYIGEIVDTDKGRNAQQLRWDIGMKTIRCNGCKNEHDKQKFKGRPYSLYVFDEIADFLKSQYEFIITWNRSSIPGERCRVLCTGNPPTTPEGRWVVEYWAPWLDPTYPNPAKEGELRWFTTDKNGKSIEVNGRGPHEIKHDDGSIETLLARSRSFIRGWLKDNPYLASTDYAASLDALPAELRAAYRDGRFDLALEDNPRQVIPVQWVIEAQKRWTAKPPAYVPMCAIGVDPAQGGPDETVLAPRHDGWYAPLIVVPGEKTPNGQSIVNLIIGARRDSALPIVDLGGGYGGATKEKLEEIPIKVAGHKGAAGSTARSVCKNYCFANKRAEAYWRFREALDPLQAGGSQICLPDDPKLVADLCAPCFTIKKSKNGLEILIESKDDIKARLGRSPDRGDAVVMGWTAGAKSETDGKIWHDARLNRGNMPAVKMGHESARRTRQ